MVSIIVACLNSGKTLQDTLESIFNQSYKDVETIVIDGGSTDQTLAILEKYRKQVTRDKLPHFALRATRGEQVARNELWSKTHDLRPTFLWTSEKDRGIADAFNKGVSMAHGDYIYFLGADDLLKAPNVVEQMMDGVDPAKDMIICGKVDRIKLSKKYSVIFTYSLRFSPWMLLYKMGMPHQGIFMNKRFFHTYGIFDIHLRYAMDYDLLLRAYHEFPKVILKDIVVAGWREGGVGNDKLFEVLDEYHQIRIKNHIAPTWILRLIHETVKARYFIVNYLEHWIK